VRAREEIRSRALRVVHDLLEVERVPFVAAVHGARAEGPARGEARRATVRRAKRSTTRFFNHDAKIE